MSFEKKLPPFKLILSIEEYNKLIELLASTEGLDMENIKEKGEDIRSKLLKYSSPKEDKIETRFYPSQLEQILYILLFNSRELEVSENYYKLLLNNREEYKNNTKENDLEEGGN